MLCCTVLGVALFCLVTDYTSSETLSGRKIEDCRGISGKIKSLLFASLSASSREYL